MNGTGSSTERLSQKTLWPYSTHLKTGDCLIRLTWTQRALDISPLDGIGWLADQSEELSNWASSVGRWRRADAGQFLYQAGDVPDGLYGLAEGALELSFPLVAEEPVVLHRADVGFWIGDAAVLSRRPRLISIVTATPARVLHISATEVDRLLASHPQFWPAFYDLNTRNVETALTLLSESLALTVKARVCRRLLALAERDRDVQITQDALAKLLGVTRSTVRRSIAELAVEGGVETGYGTLRVTDLAVLRRHKDEQ